MNVVASLKKKIGPLPAWGWLAGLGAALVVWRRFHPSSATAAAPTDVGAAAVGGGSTSPYAVGGTGGGDGSGDLTQPTPQGTADPGVGGPGTPVVYDPVGGGSDGQPGVPPPATGPGGDQPLRGSPGGAGRPRTTKGQTSGNPRTKQLHGGGSGLVGEAQGLASVALNPHPRSSGKTRKAPAKTTQTHAPLAVTRSRSSAAVHTTTTRAAPTQVSDHGASASRVRQATTPAKNQPTPPKHVPAKTVAHKPGNQKV